jgi:hypothetical protein
LTEHGTCTSPYPFPLPVGSRQGLSAVFYGAADDYYANYEVIVVNFCIVPSRKDFIKKCMQENSKEFDYFTMRYISDSTGFSMMEVDDVFKAYPNEFRQSLIKTDDGEDCYCLNSRFGALKDAWNSYRHYAYIKWHS